MDEFPWYSSGGLIILEDLMGFKDLSNNLNLVVGP